MGYGTVGKDRDTDRDVREGQSAIRMLCEERKTGNYCEKRAAHTLLVTRMSTEVKRNT